MHINVHFIVSIPWTFYYFLLLFCPHNILPSVSIYLCILASNKNNKTYSSKLRDLKMMYDMFAHKFCFLCFFPIFHTLWTNVVGNIVRKIGRWTPCYLRCPAYRYASICPKSGDKLSLEPLMNIPWKSPGRRQVEMQWFWRILWGVFVVVFLFQTCFVDIKDFADF